MATSSSSGTPGDLILDSLEDLLEYDFKKCKSKLSDFSKGNKRPIPRGHLENANRINTKDLLVDKYGEVEALDVLIEVLKQIGLMRPASDLLERRGQAELKGKHMELVKEKFQQVEEHNTRLGECVSLQAKYICLLIREGYPDRKDVEHEIERGRRSRPTMEKRSAEYNLTSLDALFDPNIDGIIPKVVVLHGPAGIGKTWTSRKIMLDWASGDLYQDKFDYLFYLSCRELNKITGRMSLVQLLSRTHNLTSDDLMTILKYSGNHQRLLFVIDGFDEFQWALEEVAEAGHDLSEETHKEALLQSLIRRPVLSQSSLLITTRSLAQKKLKPFIGMHSRYTELRGFSDEGRRKYVKNFFKNEADAEKALSVIEDNSILFIMCTVPILCWIVCTMLRKEMDNFLDFLQYKTTTSIYLQYLKGLMNYHGRNRPLSACLRKLCSLAKDGVLNQKILFKEMDLQNHGLSVSEVESVFLNENIFDDSFETETCYSFIHVSVQEFLAALYDVLDDGDEERASGLTGEASLPEICKGGSLPELCDEHPHLSSAVRFLLGLLFEKKLNEFSEKTGCKISLRVRSAVEEWLTGEGFDKESLASLFMYNTGLYMVACATEQK
ncbi:NACHT, LRR and PYD domains-containing protein 3-like [Gastrophryne carolinensis]